MIVDDKMLTFKGKCFHSLGFCFVKVFTSCQILGI